MAKKNEKLTRLEGDFLVLCCDLSLHRPGFAVQAFDSARRNASVVAMRHVDNKATGKSHGALLSRIDDEFETMLKQHPVDVFVRERGFTRFARETQSLIKVVGVIDMALHRHNGLEFHEIAPLSVKKLVAGTGKASKGDVAEALGKYVGERQYHCDDESDAVAVGIAWLIQEEYLDA